MEQARDRRAFLRDAALLLAGAAMPDPLIAGDGPARRSRIIDIHQHQHYHGWTDEQLVAHQEAMGIGLTILLPAGSPVDRPSTHFGACEVPDLPGAADEIETYLKLGAVVIGELKFEVECDAPEMQRIYQLAQAYEVPVLMHWEHMKYNLGFDRFHRMLEKYPRVNFIGHAVTWWANVDRNHLDQSVMYPKGPVTPGGLTDRLLRDYPNLYGDLSAGSGLNSILRDIGQAKAFLERHQDKLLYGSDCADLNGDARQGCTGAQTLQKIRELSDSRRMMNKILFRNAEKLFRL
jgi:predicted TIM-barrel fold metal-dependent hydrolase